jgi:hypothetical protein
VARIPTLDHLKRLTDDAGVIQHAIIDVPNRNTGYCTDDVARGFAVALAAAGYPQLREDALALAGVYLAFLLDAQLPSGRFRNFMGYDRMWLDAREGSPDSNGRAVLALGIGLRRAPKESWRILCAEAIERALPALEPGGALRPIAFEAIGLYHALAAKPGHAPFSAALRAAGDALCASFERARAPGWDWFEDALVYDNARLVEGLLGAGAALKEPRFVQTGLAALDFLESVCFENDIFVPVGNAGWYRRGGERARFCQQPLEAASMVDAERLAYELTGDFRRLRLARLANEWYYGANLRGQIMVEAGGCRDGLGVDSVNRNMGAESTLSYLSSGFAIAEMAAEDAGEIGRVVR